MAPVSSSLACIWEDVMVVTGWKFSDMRCLYCFGNKIAN